MKKQVYTVLISLISFFVSIAAYSQDSLSTTGQRDIYADPYAYRDTLYVEQFSYTDLFLEKEYDDTTLVRRDLWFNPTQSEEFLIASLGNLGSAHLKDYHEVDKSIGIQLHYPQYNLYKFPTITPEYEINTSYTDLAFSQGADQSQQALRADFVAKYNPGKLSIGYKRINNNGSYLSQLNVHTGIYAKVDLNLKSVLLQLQFNSNIIQAQDNGGFVEGASFPPPFKTFSSDVPVHLIPGAAQTRHHEKHYIIRDYWPIVGQLRDSSFLAIRHQFKYSNQYSRFYDTNPAENYYPGSMYDHRGIRSFAQDNLLENSFHALWRTRQLPWLKGQLNAGLIHQWHFLEQYFDKRQVQWAAVDAQLQTDIGDLLQLESSFTQSFSPDLKDTRFTNTLSLRWRKLFNIRGNLNLIRRRPAFNEEIFYVNASTLWNNHLNPQTSYQLGGSIEAIPLKTAVGIDYQRISNLIYYTDDMLRHQADYGVNVLRSYIKTAFKYGPIHLDSETTLQLTQNDLLPYASLVSDLRAYVRFYLFKKKMQITTGPYGKFYTQPHGYTYSPLIGQFVLTDSTAPSTPYQLNYMLSFRVMSLTIFGHFNGIQSFWNSAPFYEIQDYAHPIIEYRIGLNWKLYN